MACDRCPIGAGCFGERTPWACKWAGPDAADSERESLRILSGIEPAPPAAYPSIVVQARNLAGSLATWLRAGLPITPAAERARRRGICTGGEGRPACDQFDPDQRRCRKCGCFGELKPWLGTATCPLGKWDDPRQDDDET